MSIRSCDPFTAVQPTRTAAPGPPTGPDRPVYRTVPPGTSCAPAPTPGARDRRCVALGWTLVVIAVILVLAVIGFFSLLF